MSEAALKKELEELRAQLETLSKARAEPESPSGSEYGAQTVHRAKELATNVDLAEVSEWVGSYLRTLGNDVKESKPKALVAAFLAGVAVGRMLAR